VDDYTLEVARTTEAACLAEMSKTLVERGLQPTWHATRIARHIVHPESIVLTARAMGELAGFAIMQYGDDRAHLNLLAVAPAQRRRGIGRQLMSWLEATAFTAGSFVIGLELRASNTLGYAFYANLGYHETGRIGGYYQGIEQAILMRRDLRVDRRRQA